MSSTPSSSGKKATYLLEAPVPCKGSSPLHHLLVLHNGGRLSSVHVRAYFTEVQWCAEFFGVHPNVDVMSGKGPSFPLTFSGSFY